MKIITYATHSEGLFEELSKNKEIIVIGYGTKWEGFIGKAKYINKYLNTLPDDEVVVIVDGFDTIIKKTDNLLEEFLKFNCKVLYSQEDKNGISNYLPSFLHKYIILKVFGTCKDNLTANAGLYMGYVGYLKKVLPILINGKSDDDQRNVNESCMLFPFLQIDKNKIIFENCSSMEEVNNSKAYICQIPGNLSFNRIKRAMVEYPKFFIPEIIFVIIIITLLIYGFSKKTSKKLR